MARSNVATLAERTMNTKQAPPDYPRHVQPRHGRSAGR